MEKANILVVDDQSEVQNLMKLLLEKRGHTPLIAGSGKEALNIVKKSEPDLIISDQMMPGMTGIELLKEVKNIRPDIPFIILTGHGDVECAVSAMKEGADDYLQKPIDIRLLEPSIKRSLHYRAVSKENTSLKKQMKQKDGFESIIFRSSAMKKAIQLAQQVAESPDTTVSIFGESGTGKELMARAIHSASDEVKGPFVGINCAGIPHTLLEAELFGYVKGAFTGADRDHEGKFHAARGGTLLLDEIGDMPELLQVKLLRVLEERRYECIGSTESRPTDFRVIAATHRRLPELIESGKFREDLYHRINIFPLRLPPLRERKEDIPLLAEHFLALFRNHLGKKIPGISQEAMRVMMENYHWPGNVRELKNCLERAVIISKSELIRSDHLTLRRRVERAPFPDDGDPGRISLQISFAEENFSLDAVIRETMQTVLERCDNNKAKAARLLKINRNMFYRRK